MKALKRTVSVLLLAVLLFSMTGCSDTAVAERKVRAMMTVIRHLDMETAQKYFDLNDLTGGNFTEEQLEEFGPVLEDLCKEIDYEILSSEQIDETTVEVKTSITAVDMEPVFKDFMADFLPYALGASFSGTSEEEMTEKAAAYFEEALEDHKTEKTTVTVDIQVIKGEDGWEVNAEETLLNALFGGLLDSIEAFSEGLGL